MEGFISRRPLLAFFILSYALTWSVTVPVMLSERGLISVHLPQHLEAIAAFGPFFAGLIVLRITRGLAGTAALLKSTFSWNMPRAWGWFALLSPVGLFWGAYIIVAIFSGGRPESDADRLALILTLRGFSDLIIIGGLCQGLGEEPGWRGYALPRLRERFGPFAATLALYPVWLFWHAPAFLARPEFGAAQAVGFAVGILSAAMWLTLINDFTRSVAAAVAWHAVVNMTRGLALAMSTTMFLVFNNLVLLGALIIGIYWWRVRQGRYEPSEV